VGTCHNAIPQDKLASWSSTPFQKHSAAAAEAVWGDMWLGALGAPLGFYVCTVGGGASLVMTWTEPMVDAAAAKAVLAAVVRLIETA